MATSRHGLRARALGCRHSLALGASAYRRPVPAPGLARVVNDLSHLPKKFRTAKTARAGLVRAIRLALSACPEESVFTDTPCGAGSLTAGFGVRVVERYRTRRAPGVVFGDPNDLLGPGSTTDASDWTPKQGALPLHR